MKGRHQVYVFFPRAPNTQRELALRLWVIGRRQPSGYSKLHIIPGVIVTSDPFLWQNPCPPVRGEMGKPLQSWFVLQ